VKKKKIIETTATETQTQRSEPQNSQNGAEEISDPFEFFRDETCECLIAIRRIEPVMERGTHVAGHLPSLTLSPEEARNLAATLMQKPGYGGGLYHLQCQRRKPETGKYVFAAGFRFRVAGPSRALEVIDVSNQPVAPTPVAPQMASAAPSYPPPPPWYHQPPQPIQQPMQQGQLMSELPRLLQGLAEFLRSQSSAPNLDVVNVIQALQNTVKGEDDFAKFQKFMVMMRNMQGQPPVDNSSVLASVDWGAVLGSVKDILRPPAPQIPAGPPGWNWDPANSRWVKAQAPTPTPPLSAIPAPPGWKWEKGQWVNISDDDDSEDEGEDQEEDEEDSDEPLNADEMANVVIREMQKMPESEQARLKEMARAMFAP
jgi:hypothetical protein